MLYVSKILMSDFFSYFQIGELIFIDWMPHKDSESGKLVSQYKTFFLLIFIVHS